MLPGAQQQKPRKKAQVETLRLDKGVAGHIEQACIEEAIYIVPKGHHSGVAISNMILNLRDHFQYDGNMPRWTRAEVSKSGDGK